MLMIMNKETVLQMNNEDKKMTEEEIISLADRILAVEREVRSDKTGNRTVIVGRILSLLNEVMEDDN